MTKVGRIIFYLDCMNAKLENHGLLLWLQLTKFEVVRGIEWISIVKVIVEKLIWTMWHWERVDQPWSERGYEWKRGIAIYGKVNKNREIMNV